MPFRSLLRLFVQVALVLLVIEGVRWWLGGQLRVERAFEFLAWAALILLLVWSRPDDPTIARDRAELARWQMAWRSYNRWLAEFPDIELVLDNLKAEAEGRELSLMWPPGAVGPWEISRLRDVLRQRALARTSFLEAVAR